MFGGPLKIINALQGPLNHQTDLKKMPFMTHIFTFMTFMGHLDRLH